MTLKTLKNKLDKLPTKSTTPQIIVCWCTDFETCPHHAARTVEWPEPRHVRTVAGVNLKDI